MGISIRHLLVDQNDEVYRLSNRFFERLLDKSPELFFHNSRDDEFDALKWQCKWITISRSV